MATIDNAIYDRIPRTWWDEDGFMALLRTVVNPPRFGYFHKVLVERLGLDPRTLRMLDVGCGGGLLSERFAATGCTVTGIDRSAPTLSAARAHAQASALTIDYLEGSAEELPFGAGEFDLAVCCDVLEHVDDIDRVVGEIARVLKPGGVFFFDTINRTPRSRLLAIKLAQDWCLTRLIPRDVHVWDKFVRPAELSAVLAGHGLPDCGIAGLSPGGSPFRALAGIVQKKLGRITFEQLGERLTLRESRDMSVSYMGYAVRSLRA